MNLSSDPCLPRPWQSILLSHIRGIAVLWFVWFVPTNTQAQNNIPPEIVGQQPLSISADNPLAITLEDLLVVDPDNSYPDDFTLKLSEASENFHVSDNTIVPDEGLHGSLEVTVVVNDGTTDSEPYTLTVDVLATTGKGEGDKGKEPNGGPGKDQADNKGPEKKDDDKGPGKKDEDKGPGKKEEDKGPGKKEEDKGPGKKEEDKAPEKKDDKKDDKKKDDEKKGGDKGDPGKSDDKNNGPDKKDDGPGKDGGPGKGGGPGKDDGPGKGNGPGEDKGPDEDKTPDKGKDPGEDKGPDKKPDNKDDKNNDGAGDNKADVSAPTNVAPVITGQHEITTAKNVAVVLDLNMLKVDDPDNTYPDDFSIQVFEGSNYTLDGLKVIPVQDFTGTLDVPVRVNDGIASSNSFTLRITVREGNIPPQILGQASLATDEETPLSIGFDDLIVFDPDTPYPNGFSLRLHDGEHYNVKRTTIEPTENFTGQLTVMVTVHDGKLESDPYPLMIMVNPVNDPPVLDNIERSVLPYLANGGPASVTERIQVREFDGDNIVGAEVSFNMSTYQSGHDILTFEPPAETNLSIQGLFDADNATLHLIGSASASDYETALRSIAYSFNHENQESIQATTKTLSIVVRDAKSESNVVTREIAFSSEIALDVPRAFTPNGDMANDTWSVKPIQNAEDYEDAITRIYTIRGELLYEASGFEWEWDGRYQGQYLPTGTYYYIISIRSGLNMSNRKGVVTILR